MLIKERKVNEELRENNKELRMEITENEFRKEKGYKKAYKFLAYIIHDWSNRTWVISKYQNAKEKCKQHETLLKCILTSYGLIMGQLLIDHFSHTLLLTNIIVKIQILLSTHM